MTKDQEKRDENKQKVQRDERWVVQQAGGLGRELEDEKCQEEEDETGDRQAVSTVVSDDRVTQHLVRVCFQLLSSCCKTQIPAQL